MRLALASGKLKSSVLFGVDHEPVFLALPLDSETCLC